MGADTPGLQRSQWCHVPATALKGCPATVLEWTGRGRLRPRHASSGSAQHRVSAAKRRDPAALRDSRVMTLQPRGSLTAPVDISIDLSTCDDRTHHARSHSTPQSTSLKPPADTGHRRAARRRTAALGPCTPPDRVRPFVNHQHQHQHHGVAPARKELPKEVEPTREGDHSLNQNLGV